jgi:hypothetical protein
MTLGVRDDFGRTCQALDLIMDGQGIAKVDTSRFYKSFTAV